MPDWMAYCFLALFLAAIASLVVIIITFTLVLLKDILKELFR